MNDDRDRAVNGCDYIKKSELISKLQSKVMKCKDYSKGSFEHKVSKYYSTIWLFQKAVIRIREVKNELRVEIKKDYLELFDLKKGATFRESDANWGRLPSGNHIITRILDKIEVVFEQCYLDGSVEVFGCCSRYVECSDSKGCVHPDRRFAQGCMYKSNLEKGRIFYGVNRNMP